MNIKEWMQALMSDSPDVSSKRFVGLVGFTVVLVVFAIVTLSTSKDFSQTEESVFNTLTIIFGILVGGGTIQRIGTKIKGK